LDPSFLTWFFVFTRAGALLALFPALAAQNIPVRLRIALAAALAFLTVPLLPPVALADLSLWGVIRLLFVEASVGLLLGFVSRLVFFAIDLAGGIASTEIGLMLSATFNPLTANALPVPGTILFWLTMMLLFSLNLHHWILAAFQHSYTLAPLGAAHITGGLAEDIVRRTAGIFVVAIQMTAPVLAVSFVITLIFSVLSRAVPQMNVFTESMPVRTMAGLAVFGFTCHLMALHIENYLRRLPDDMLKICRLLNSS
jgi:flagellar biosynthetic protein FliR